jgi:hypothetical protein
MGAMDLPNPTHTISLEGVGQERLGLVLYEIGTLNGQNT